MSEKINKDLQIVDLISYPENPIKTIYTACRTCYSAETPISIYEQDTDESKMLNLIKKVIASGHHSTIEHCTYVFAVSGVSRACTHQLVRHRHMSFSQKSQRYVTEKGGFEYVTPPTIFNSEFNDEYQEFMKKTAEFYSKLTENGILAEDARSILPNATTSSLTLSLNLRELIHLANIRLCTNAQLEIRQLVKKMCIAVIEKENWLKDYLEPKCVSLGYCDEIRGCGRYPSKKEVLGS